MTYGLRFTNSSDVVILDSEFARLVILDTGTWSGNGSGITVSFSKVINTIEPPLVFVRPNQSITFCFCKIIGSTGAWRGFSFVGISGQSTSGKWFCAGFKSSETARFGMRLWDGDSNLLFDTGTPCAQFTRSISSWSYLGSSSTGQGTSRLSWTSSSSLSTDYMMLNNIAMDIGGTQSRQGSIYAVWQYNNDRLVIQAVGVDMSTSLYNTVIFAKPIS